MPASAPIIVATSTASPAVAAYRVQRGPYGTAVETRIGPRRLRGNPYPPVTPSGGSPPACER